MSRALCLGVETSCDETAVALVDDGRLVRSLTASQANLHSLFGGVVPELASREHYRYLGPLFDRLLLETEIEPRSIDLVAVARGPGLLGSLLVGVAFAKSLAWSLNVPLVGVDHLRAHLLAAGLTGELIYPAVGLLASGGHTHLYYIKSDRDFALLGSTLDDAAGEAFDKIGCALRFRYPAGPEIDARAQKGRAAYNLPRPYLDNDNLDFSFSGLKTAAINLAGKNRFKEGEIDDFCASLNLAIAETLVAKTARALDGRDAASVWLAGGVAANSLVREKMADLAASRGLRFIAPPRELCGDNAAMIAYNGWALARRGLEHDLDLEAIPRGRKIPDDYRASR